MSDTQAAGTPAADDQRRCPVTDFRFGRCELYDGHLNRDDPGDRHRTGSVLWADDAQRTAAPTLTSFAGAVPDLTGGVDPAAYVKAQWCPHHDDAAVCAAWLETPADTPEPSTPPAEPADTAPAAAGGHPGTLDGAPGVLGRALIDDRGHLWWPRPEHERSAYGRPVREVLLVSPAVGRVLDALREWREAFRPIQNVTVHNSATYMRHVELQGALAAAVDALDGPTTGGVSSTANNIQPEAKPAPEPHSGPGWDRSNIERIIAMVNASPLGASNDGDQLHALLASHDQRAEVATAALYQADLANQQRDTARAELAVVADDRDRHQQHATATAGKLVEEHLAYQHALDELDQARVELAEVTADRDRLREHSVTLNSIAWKVATALGDVPEGADRIVGNPAEQVDRLVVELATARSDHDRLRGERDDLRHQAAAVWMMLATARAELATARRDAELERRDITDAAERREALISQNRQHMDSCIWIDPGRRSGAPCLGGTRLDVDLIAGLMDDGMDGDAIRGLYPDVADEHLTAVRHFVQEVDRERSDAAADALDEAADRAEKLRWPAVKIPQLREWAGDHRAIEHVRRPVPGSPEPAPAGGEEADHG